jgi:hypothetical protein
MCALWRKNLVGAESGYFSGFARVFEGVFGKSVFSGWFFVVTLWWFCGESVVVG